MRRVLLVLVLLASFSVGASTYTVDDFGDAGDSTPGDDVCDTGENLCTLRAAIEEANAHAGADTIEFTIGGLITPATVLPAMTEQTTIDGTSASDYLGEPVVLIDGAASSAIGLHFDLGSDNSALIALEISGFSTAGVLVDADAVTIRGNYLGPVSLVTPNLDGLQLNGNGSTIGGADGEGNVISGNDQHGVVVSGANHDIRDNFIGVDDTGLAMLSNGDDGISVTGSALGPLTIGSATAGEENVISGNFDVGVSIDGGSGTVVAGNYIGLDVTGTAAIPNFIGVEVSSPGNTVGTTAAGNVISGNDDDGVDINAPNTIVHNNIIGPDVTGLAGIGNFGFGIAAFVVSNIDIGGSGAGEGNVISFNGLEGILTFEVDTSRITSNIVGLDAAGTSTLGNGLEGILLIDSSDVTVASNIVSGNSAGGIVDAGGLTNIIELNRVGTTADGSAAIGNLGTGIEIFATVDTIIRSNVVSANDGHGIEATLGATGSVIHSNIVGLSADLATPLGNGLDGINVCDGAADTVVGSVALGGNTISANLENGIGVEPTALSGNTWAANSIFDNDLLGIDIGIDGVTPNDPDDPDTGANEYQNFPDLVSAVTTPTASQVRGTIDTLASTAFAIHFYSSPAADPSGFGEGQTYLGTTNGTTDANGDATFVFTGPALTVGHVVTATATTTDGTSEFSATADVAVAPTISFSSATYTIGEAGVSATITVNRSGNLDAISTVDYATSNNTATDGSDYTAASGMLTFAAGDDSETFIVPITDDANDEPDELVNLTLSNATAATLAMPSTAQLTITDDDAAPTISITNVSLNEGNAGTTAFGFDVTLLVASGFTVTVDYATANGTATAGSDYTAIGTTTLTFNPGVTSQSVSVSVAGDTVFESDETFFVDLVNPVNATFADDQGLGTILNDEAALTVSIDDVTQNEGDAGSTSFAFTLTLSGPSDTDVTVNYATADDSATAGSDYTAQTNVATIVAGNTTTTVDVPVSGDVAFEPDETFFVNLTGASNATIADNQGLGTILNDEAALTVSIDDVTQNEGDAGSTSFAFTLTLSGPSDTDVTVNYATADDSATAGSDYTAQANVATIVAGNTTTTVDVPVSGDVTFEPDETFFVNLTGASNATIADNQGLGTIINDDESADVTITKTASTPTFSPGQQVTFTITVQNLGPSPAISLTVTDVLPAGATFVSATGPDATCTGTTTVTCTIPTLASGASTAIMLVVTANGDAPIANTATVAAASPTDPTPGNNADAATINPAAIGDIPTMSEWGLLMLALALAFIAMKKS